MVYDVNINVKFFAIEIDKSRSGIITKAVLIWGKNASVESSKSRLPSSFK